MAALALLGGSGTSLSGDVGRRGAASAPSKGRGHDSGKGSAGGAKTDRGGRHQNNEQLAPSQQSRGKNRAGKPPNAPGEQQKGNKKDKPSRAPVSTQPQQAGRKVATDEWPIAPPLRGDGQVTVLHVAEKPSIAQALANALCGKGNKRAEQRHGTTPVHEFTSVPFQVPGTSSSVRCRHRVTSVVGHVFSVDFPPQYQNWDSTNPAVTSHLHPAAHDAHTIR